MDVIRTDCCSHPVAAADMPSSQSPSALCFPQVPLAHDPELRHRGKPLVAVEQEVVSL